MKLFNFSKISPIALVFLVFTVFRLLFINFLPTWDSTSVTRCMLFSLRPELAISELNCHHPSIGYLGIHALFQSLDWGNTAIIGLTQLFLALLGLYAFYKIVLFLFSNQQNVHQQNSSQLTALATFLLAFNPLYFANSIFPSLDFGVTIFFLLSLYSLMYKHRLQAALFMSLLVLTKEPGFILYIALLSGYLLASIINKRKFITIAFIFLPLLTFLLFFQYQMGITTGHAFWTNQPLKLLQLNKLNRVWIFRGFTRFLQIFILNFNWLLSLSIFFAFYKSAGTSLKRIRKYLFDAQNIWWLTIFFAFISYAVPIISLNTYTLPRYVLPLVPLYIAIFILVLKLIITNTKKQKIILCVIAALFFLQTFITVDPLSKLVFGTFSFGRHKMLRMTRYVNECCGYAGKDQLAYNAEYAFIDPLINKLYRTLPLKTDRPLFIAGLDAAELFIQADIKTYRRTLRKKGIIVPTVYITNDLPQIRKDLLPQNAYYIFLPWNDILEDELHKISQYYEIGNKEIIDYAGYQLMYFPLRLKRN